MRRLMSAMFHIVVATSLAACGMTKQYVEGVGSELYWDGLPNITVLQDAYVAEICHQAGLSTDAAGTARSCNPDAHDPYQWFDFVQAGMNDIDQRCDAYLAWLDDRKRTSQSVLHEITDVRTAAIAIMSITGAGVEPIAIAASAIGLAADSFANSDLRLLVGLDHSTIQQIVLTSQATFRNTLPRVINNRPAALYALRLYLRICTPYAIEAKVNTTMKLYERGGLQALKAAEANPIASGRGVASAVSPTLANASEPLSPPVPEPPGQRPRTFVARPFEESLNTKTIENIQTALCVKPTGSLGPDGSETRVAIRSYLKAAGKRATQTIDQTNYGSIYKAIVLIVFHGGSSCGSIGLDSAEEVAKKIFHH